MASRFPTPSNLPSSHKNAMFYECVTAKIRRWIAGHGLAYQNIIVVVVVSIRKMVFIHPLMKDSTFLLVLCQFCEYIFKGFVFVV